MNVDRETVTIQQTGKTYKIQMVMAVLLALTGVLLLTIDLTSSIPAWMMIGGALWFVIATFLAWFDHG